MTSKKSMRRWRSGTEVFWKPTGMVGWVVNDAHGESSTLRDSILVQWQSGRIEKIPFDKHESLGRVLTEEVIDDMLRKKD